MFQQIIVSRTKCFGQKKNTVETYFTNSSLQRRDSFPGTQGKLDLITPKINTVSELTLVIQTPVNANSGHRSTTSLMMHTLSTAISLT